MTKLKPELSSEWAQIFSSATGRENCRGVASRERGGFSVQYDGCKECTNKNTFMTALCGCTSGFEGPDSYGS
jgi:hypothetical protein